MIVMVAPVFRCPLLPRGVDVIGYESGSLVCDYHWDGRVPT